jgi:hypothetical protein
MLIRPLLGSGREPAGKACRKKPAHKSVGKISVHWVANSKGRELYRAAIEVLLRLIICHDGELPINDTPEAVRLPDSNTELSFRTNDIQFPDLQK